MEDRLKQKAIGMLILTAVLWSFGGLFIKLIDAPPMAIAGCRSFVAAIVFWIALKKPKFTFSFPQIAAAISYAAIVICFVSSNKLTNAATAILLQYTAPIYIAILGPWILNEKAKLLDWITVLFVVGGMFFFFLGELDPKNLLGTLIAAGSGVGFALFTIFMRMQKDESPMESVFLGNVITAIIGIPFLLQGSPAPMGWFYLLLLGVFQLGLSYVLYAKAIRHTTALESSIILVLEPILNPVWVFLMLGEAPGKNIIFGGLIVILTVMIRSLISSRKVSTIEVNT